MSAILPVARRNKKKTIRVCSRSLLSARSTIAQADRGRAAEWQGKRVGRGRRLPGDPDPVPTSNSPGARALRVFPGGAQIGGGGGGCWASDAPTHPSQRTPLPVHVRPYHVEKDPGMEPSKGSCTELRTRCVFYCLESLQQQRVYPPHRDTRSLSNRSPPA